MSISVVAIEQALAALPTQKLFINGKWTESDSKEVLEVHSPSTGKLLATVPHASEKDVDRKSVV